MIFYLFLLEGFEVYLKAKIEKLALADDQNVSEKMSEYNLKNAENYSSKSIADSKASVYFTPNESQFSPEPLQLQLSPIHINYINDGLNFKDMPRSFKNICAPPPNYRQEHDLYNIYQINMHPSDDCTPIAEDPNQMNVVYFNKPLNCQSAEDEDDEQDLNIKQYRKRQRKRKSDERSAKMIYENETLLMTNLKEGECPSTSTGRNRTRDINMRRNKNKNYYYSLEDMIQDSNEKLMKMVQESETDLMNVIKMEAEGASGSSGASGYSAVNADVYGDSKVLNVTEASNECSSCRQKSNLINSNISSNVQNDVNNSVNEDGIKLFTFNTPRSVARNIMLQSTSLPEINYDSASPSSSGSSTVVNSLNQSQKTINTAVVQGKGHGKHVVLAVEDNIIHEN
jgi:hypothetical protein